MNKPEDAPLSFQDAWNNHDMEALAALFHPDAMFVNRFGRHGRSRSTCTAVAAL